MQEALKVRQKMFATAQAALYSGGIEKSRERNNWRLLFAVLLTLLCFSWSVTAGNCQTTFGSVVGSVTDSSGALLAGASVTLTNVATNEAHKMSTSSSGLFSFADLQPGVYRVDVDSAGFKHLALNGIEVQVGGTTRASAVMQVGGESQTVEVSTAAPLIQTDSANLGGVIEGRAVQSIPLNGRNVNNLLELVPGVQAGGTTSGNLSTNEIAYGNYQIGGGFGNQSAFYIDGVLSNMPSNNALALIPSQDTVQEFQVTTSDVSAEFGGFAGGIVSISTKAGTNEFHGSAYEYTRARILNANDFFSNQLHRARQSWVQNQFGATVGGPVMKNKVFFFGGFEREPVVSGSFPTVSTVPSSAELGVSGVAACPGCGDFSAPGLPTIYDPLTNAQFVCNGVANVICANRIDPAVAAILKMNYPTTLQDGKTPIPAGSNNWTAVTRTHYLLSTYNFRGDYNINSKNVLFGRYTQFLDQSFSTPAYPGVQAFTVAGYSGITDKQIIIGDTHTLNPTTVLDGRISYLRAYQFQPPRGLGTDVSGISSGLAAMQSALIQHLPVTLNFAPFAGGTRPGQLYWYENMYMASGSVTKVIGRHTIKAGGNVRQVEWIAKPDSGGEANNFTAEATSLKNTNVGGYALASGLLGIPDSSVAQAIGGSRSFLHSYGFYVTDKFQVSRKLTADIGVRWDQPGSYSEVNNWNTVFLPNASSPLGTIINPATGTSQALVGYSPLVNTPAYPGRREEYLHWNLWSPRVGLAYRVNENTVLRGGYGISYLPSTLSQDGPNSNSVNTETTTLSNSAAYNTPGTTGGFNQAGVVTSVANPFPTGVLTPSRGNPAGLNVLYGQNIQARVPNQPYSYVQQWNFGIQQQLWSNASVSLAYGGAHGTHLQAQGANTWSAANLNQIPDSYVLTPACQAATSANPTNNGTCSLETKVNNPFYGTVAANGILAAPTAFTGYFERPFPQYNYVTAAGSRNSASEYRSLQVAYKERFPHEGLLSAAYTWANLMSNTDTVTQFLEGGGDGYQGTVQDNNNLQGEWSKSSSDFPYNLTIGYAVGLPIGKGEPLLGSLSGPADVIISGWKVNGVTIFRAGQPIGLLANQNDVAKYFGGGGYYQNGVGQGTTRPTVVGGCDPKIHMSGLAKVNAGKWYNTSCFIQPAGIFQYGNEPRVDPVLRRDGIKNFDFSVAKATHLTEHLTFNFTAEFYNLFNRVQFAAPPAALYDATPGKVTSQANNPRQIQFGGRFEF